MLQEKKSLRFDLIFLMGKLRFFLTINSKTKYKFELLLLLM